MKKWIAGILGVGVIFLVIVYLTIPSRLQVTVSAGARCAEPAATRLIADTTKWRLWWPANTGTFLLNNYVFILTKKMYNAYEVKIVHETDTALSSIIVLPFGRDSLSIRWTAVMNTGVNPFNRIKANKKINRLKGEITRLQESLSSYLNSSTNVYGINIGLTTLKDTTLIATKKYYQTYPTTEAIYQMIDELKAYIAKCGAKETNYPMLNVRKDDLGFLAMVAIPTDRELEQNGNLFTRRMIIIKDNTLLTETRGGVSTVKAAYQVLNNYMQDHRYGSPAIPFESLVTDRRKETDTAKWITRIFAPIM